MNEKPSEWCEAVKKTMINKGMSIKRLAEETGYCSSTISMVLNGKYSRGGRREIKKKIDSVLCAEAAPKLPQWYGDVKNAMRDKGMSVRQLAEETGYSVSTVSQTINGRYANRNYQAIAGRINSVLGTEGMPERICTSLDEWCKSARIELIRKNMSISQLAESAGVTRDRMSYLLNGRKMDQQLVGTVSRLLGIALPEAASECLNYSRRAGGGKWEKTL